MITKILEVGYGKVKKVKIGAKLPLAFIGGPCARLKARIMPSKWLMLLVKYV